MSPRQLGTKLTREDLVLFPDDGMRHELIAGERRVTPAPETWDEKVSLRLLPRLFQQIEEQGLGGGLQRPDRPPALRPRRRRAARSRGREPPTRRLPQGEHLVRANPRRDRRFAPRVVRDCPTGGADSIARSGTRWILLPTPVGQCSEATGRSSWRLSRLFPPTQVSRRSVIGSTFLSLSARPSALSIAARRYRKKKWKASSQRGWRPGVHSSLVRARSPGSEQPHRLHCGRQSRGGGAYQSSRLFVEAPCSGHTFLDSRGGAWVCSTPHLDSSGVRDRDGVRESVATGCVHRVDESITAFLARFPEFSSSLRRTTGRRARRYRWRKFADHSLAPSPPLPPCHGGGTAHHVLEDPVLARSHSDPGNERAGWNERHGSHETYEDGVRAFMSGPSLC